MSLIRNVKTAGLRLRLVDAKGQVVGRLATHLATILQGKDKPNFCPNKDDGDVVVVVNARHVEFTGKKWDQKLYRWHSGYQGGLKQRTAQEQFDREPGDVLRRAVVGMLPNNILRKARARKLRIFPDEEHPFAAHPQLVRYEPPPRNLREKGDIFIIPEGMQPMNPEAYQKRFGYRLAKLKARAAVQQQDSS